MTVLAPDEARRIAVAAQGLHGFDVAGDAASVLRRLGCIQIDSMSAVRRSHELVLLGRGAPAEPGVGRCFEGMAHALSLIAMELWPAFGFRRRHVRVRHPAGSPGMGDRRGHLSLVRWTVSSIWDLRLVGVVSAV